MGYRLAWSGVAALLLVVIVIATWQSSEVAHEDRINTLTSVSNQLALTDNAETLLVAAILRMNDESSTSTTRVSGDGYSGRAGFPDFTGLRALQGLGKRGRRMDRAVRSVG